MTLLREETNIMKTQFKARDYTYRPTALALGFQSAGIITGNIPLVREPKLAVNEKPISADFKAAA
jgi:hypothetical protein